MTRGHFVFTKAHVVTVVLASYTPGVTCPGLRERLKHSGAGENLGGWREGGGRQAAERRHASTTPSPPTQQMCPVVEHGSIKYIHSPVIYSFRFCT